MKEFIYSKEKARKTVCPLGGMGTGCIALSADGRLVNFDLFGKTPGKPCDGFSFFAVKAETDGKIKDARVLHCQAENGFAANLHSLDGLACFDNVEFKFSFPFAELNFCHEDFPGLVKMTAFNPFVVTNDLDSSIPCGMFEIEFENNTSEKTDYTVCQCVSGINGSTNNFFHTDNDGIIKNITLKPYDDKLHPSEYAEMCVSTDCSEVSYSEYWLRGSWAEGLKSFYNDFAESSKMQNRYYTLPFDSQDTASLCCHVSVEPGEKKSVRFVLSWYLPYSFNYINTIPKAQDEGDKEYLDKNSWKNYYTHFYRSAAECSAYCLHRWDKLFYESNLFRSSLYNSTLPQEITDAVGAGLCVLKSGSFVRNSDGTLRGINSLPDYTGEYKQHYTHFYNHDFATAFLFPKLERDMRVDCFKINEDIYGAISPFLSIPKGRKPENSFPFVDGQMGEILKVYREFKICGDKEWLMEIWNKVALSLDFAFDSHNEYEWDRDMDGVLNGCQYHTLGTAIFSPSPWLCGMYLAALKAGAYMAEAVGDKKHRALYTELFEKGKKWLDTNLFNGSYYFQKIDLEDKSLLTKYSLKSKDETENNAVEHYWDSALGVIKYQIGEGCSIEQLLAQWHADLLGLGDVYDKNQVKTSLETIYKENFCKNNKKGVLFCTYPEDKKKNPFPVKFADECISGFEYQFACQLMMAGKTQEALEVLRAVRARFDGEKCNPFGENEFGESCLNSLASYSLLNAACGFQFDMSRNFIGFDPVMDFAHNGTFISCFALNNSFGIVEKGPDYLEIKMLTGEMMVRYIGCPSKPLRVLYHGRKWDLKVVCDTCADMGNVYTLNPEKGIMIYL